MAKKSDKTPPAPPATAAPNAPPPLSGNVLELTLAVGAIITVGLVALLFQMTVNRVFDVPKAVALKVGGGGLFLVWLLVGLFGKGWAWRSIRIFLAPVAALTGAVIVSTLLSFDLPTSIFGVYERQFGLQGFLGCVGLFVVAATCLRSKRGALLGLAALAFLGGAIGTYALLQATGHDPYPFFDKPHNKVYAYLGNATFAGNALALIAPISALVAIVALVKTLRTGLAREDTGAYAILVAVLACAAVLAAQIAPAWWAEGVGTMTDERRQGIFKLGLSASFAFVLLLGATGSWGPSFLRFEHERSRRLADAAGAGALFAAVIGIAMGLLFTRTRGAWVGTACATVGGLVLLPGLFQRTRFYKLVRNLCWGWLAFSVVATSLYVLKAETICSDRQSRCFLVANTIRSIPAAFDPERRDFGKGQGTRRYLWMESPRVLVDHEDTLARVFDDHAFGAKYAEQIAALDLGLDPLEAPSKEDRELATSWRSAAVWAFGIGIETYRYAFMSHKSKRLEALDPMTNHDNPHNNYLYILASFGIVGLLAYLWLLYRLLTVSFSRFWKTPRRLIQHDGDGYTPDVVTAWSFDESADPPRLYLDTADERLVADSLAASDVRAKVRIENGRVVLTGFEASKILDAVARAAVEGEPTIADRAIAFGVLTSFFSYAVYSIAGFDSVACSVFLYFMLGCAAVYYAPSVDDRVRPIGVNLRRQWAAFRGRDPQTVDATRPVLLSVVIAIVGVLLLGPFPGGALQGAKMTWDAEVAFVGGRQRANSRLDMLRNRIEGVSEAIRINPYESYYKQNLGSTFSEGARLFENQAIQLARKGEAKQAAAYRAQSQQYAARATAALYAALDHSWAPENIFISAFQMHYALGQVPEAEAALERALVHSPHLGAVRGNLAVLKLQRGAFDEALKDAEWVLDVDPRSPIAHRVLGQVYTQRKDFARAREHLDQAARYSRNDRAVARAIAELDAAEAAATSTSS